MTPIEIAEFLAKFGALGVAVIEALVIVYLFKQLMEALRTIASEAKANGVAAERLADAAKLIAPLVEKLIAQDAAKRILRDHKFDPDSVA